VGAVNSPLPLTTPRGTTSRFAFVDVSRTVALWGIVVMNYHAYLNGTTSRNSLNPSVWEEIFDPRTGFLTTRFAALFVVVAGLSVAIMVRNREPEEIPHKRVVILRRGILLLLIGSIFEWIWPGTILFYYGAYFLLAAALIRARTWIIATSAITSAIVATIIQTWRVGQEFDGRYTGWLDPSFINSPRELMLRIFVGYTHPVFPWFAFFCLGLLLGRLLPQLKKYRRTLLFIAVTAGVSAYALREIVFKATEEPTRANALLRTLASTDPFDRSLLYTISAASVALVAILAIYTWCDHSTPQSSLVNALQRIGQFTFTIYIAHALFFNLVVNRLELVSRTGLDTALTLSAAFLALAVVVALWWTHVIGQGPIERCYRWLTGS
jgi:uncharacterized protein